MTGFLCLYSGQSINSVTENHLLYKVCDYWATRIPQASRLLSSSLQGATSGLGPESLWGGPSSPLSTGICFGRLRPHPCRAWWKQCLSNPAVRNVPLLDLLPKPFPAMPRDFSAVKRGQPVVINSISASLSALLNPSHLPLTTAPKHFFPPFFSISAFLLSQALKQPGVRRAGDGTKTHPFQVKILMFLRHPVAHLGSQGPKYQLYPACQAKGSRRKKNKCDDSWALANESWSERSQNKHLVLTHTQGWSERGNMEHSHHGGKGLQHEQHCSERQISCLIMLQEIPGHLLLSRVQCLHVEQEEGE